MPAYHIIFAIQTEHQKHLCKNCKYDIHFVLYKWMVFYQSMAFPENTLKFAHAHKHVHVPRRPQENRPLRTVRNDVGGLGAGARLPEFRGQTNHSAWVPGRPPAFAWLRGRPEGRGYPRANKINVTLAAQEAG